MHFAADVQGVGHPLKGRAAPVAAIITEQVPLAVHDRPPTRSGALRAPASSSPVVVAGRRASRTARRGRCWCCPPPSATARMPAQQDQLLHPRAIIKAMIHTVCSVGLTAVEGTVVACCYCWCRRAPGNAGTSRRYVTWIIIAAVVYVHCCCCFVPAVNITAASRGFSARRCIMMCQSQH